MPPDPPPADVGALVNRALTAQIARLERQLAHRDRKVATQAELLDPLAADVEIAHRVGAVLRESIARLPPRTRLLSGQLDVAEHALARGGADAAASAIKDARATLEGLVEVHGTVDRLARSAMPRTSPQLSKAAERLVTDRERPALPDPDGPP
ncbi:MAG: hypothetical protein WBD40_00210 [Tepidisphaeraceae bacterium]